MSTPLQRNPRLVMSALVGAALVPVAATLPTWPGALGSITYYIAFMAIQLLTVIGVRRVPATRRGPWNLLLAASALWAVGETYELFAYLRGVEIFPGPADLAYVSAYGVTAAAVLRLDRGGPSGRGPLLDAMIMALSVATLSVAFVVRPLLADDSQSLLVRSVSSVYPLIDVLLVYLVARLLGRGSGRRPAMLWLAAAMLSTCTADMMMNVESIVALPAGLAAVQNLLWLLYYLFVGFGAVTAGWSRTEEAPAAGHRCAARPGAWGTGPDRGRVERPDLGGLRLVLLTAAAVLPSVVIVCYGWLIPANPAISTQLGAGSVVLISLVAARIWSLIRQVRRQARLLDELAATDSLTGLANRRSWDLRLDGLIRHGAGDEVALLALLDLDHFKQFNDSRGHQAGDDLLSAAAAAWRELLGPRPTLARWGGEEFAVLLLAPDEAQGVARIDRLRQVVPSGQTVSIGVARWDGHSGAGEWIRAADQALYAAKAAGRDRTVTADRSTGQPSEQRPGSVIGPVIGPGSTRSAAVVPPVRTPVDPLPGDPLPGDPLPGEQSPAGAGPASG